MVKHTLQKAGIRRVCPLCASTDVKLDADAVGGVCKSCGKTSATMLEMSFVEVSHLKKDLAETQRMRRFSLVHCEEVQAFLFVLMLATILLVFVIIAHSRWGLW